jgi:hypothetical protein
MGLIRKTLSITFAGGLVGYRSRAEKDRREIRRAAIATQQQNGLIAEQNGLIQDQTAAIVRQQQTLIEQQAEAMRRQQEQLQNQHVVNVAPPAGGGQAERLERARRAADGSFDESQRQQGNE